VFIHKIKKIMKTKVKILIAIVCVLASTLGITVKAQVTAVDLYHYSSNNEANFNNTYTGKTIKVVGIVTSNVFQNTGEWTSGYSVWLGNCVRLFFPESNARQFAKIQQGDIITIQGRCIGRGGSLIYTYKFSRPTEVFVDNCTLIQVNETNAERLRNAQLREEREKAERRKQEELKREQEAEQRKREAAENERLAAKRREVERQAAARREAERRRCEWSVSTPDLPDAGYGVLPVYKPSGEEGLEVVIKVKLNSAGEVTDAVIDTDRTSITNARAWRSALEAAYKSECGSSGYRRGTLRYRYGLSEAEASKLSAELLNGVDVEKSSVRSSSRSNQGSGGYGSEEAKKKDERARRKRASKATEDYRQSHFYLFEAKISLGGSTREKKRYVGEPIHPIYAGVTLGFVSNYIGCYVSPQLEIEANKDADNFSAEDKAERDKSANPPLRRHVGFNNGIYTAGILFGDRSTFNLYLGGGIHRREDELANLKVLHAAVIEGGFRVAFRPCFAWNLGGAYSWHKQGLVHTGLSVIF
jgi:hypothetical protein